MRRYQAEDGGQSSEWFRSSFCSAGTCVEVRRTADFVLVRDGKQNGSPDQQMIRFDNAQWDAFQGLIASL